MEESGVPMRPKLADWYVAKFVQKGYGLETAKENVGSVPFGFVPEVIEGTSPDDESDTGEGTCLYTEDFPVPDNHVRLDMFRPLKVLGTGGVGKVLLVLLVGTDRVYAMKELRKTEMIARNKVNRVMTEREIFRTSNHPFIVTLYASFQTKKKLYFIMEYFAGGEFFAFLQKQPLQRLSEQDAMFYAAEVILALEYLHCMGFVYRDLKPENILMRSTGHIALTDFDLSKEGAYRLPIVAQKEKKGLFRRGRSGRRKGRSKSLNHDLDIVDCEPILPNSNSFVGTEEYLSPEVITGCSQTAAVDWWTLGILIYEMMCGKTPFVGECRKDTFDRIQNDDVVWPKGVSVSASCKNLVKRLLEKDPEKRICHELGATELKRHPWFHGLKFELIRNEPPPSKPDVRDPLDLSQYNGVESTDLDLEVELSDDETFAGFEVTRNGRRNS
uniref:non-specific serine/threonine protein kinase n=1 Tax=Rhodosorus marinus TaxID=101924 RepID=A0A7S2Z9S9_9RHOD|mmetsp:Transcript_11187/g.46751  ORF Transcript_11187/g.46751 Transcript_11187/m.46751 type:complete len:442 (+) Transcript_11187:3-1328(+)